MKQWLFCLLVCSLLCACATHGPVSTPVMAGGAALVAVFDQLLANGVIEPVQHLQLTQGIQSLNSGLTATQQAVEAVRAGALTQGEAATAAGGLAAGVLGIVRAWRGPKTMKTSAGVPVAPA